jgi:hypothetical protein
VGLAKGTVAYNRSARAYHKRLASTLYGDALYYDTLYSSLQLITGRHDIIYNASWVVYQHGADMNALAVFCIHRSYDL